MNDVVICEELPAGDFVVAHAQLNVESTLNSLSLEMIRLLRPALARWQQRDDVAAILITGAGDRAFCAGGDIQALYHAISANHAAGKVVNAYPFEFFEEEYRLDYELHTCTKPVICLGHGIVMGGGLGIFGGSTYRVVTERSRLAVPEITIGLFPDAGATWTLGRMQIAQALFLGLTGSHVNGHDALVTNMATHAIAGSARSDFISGLSDLAWQHEREHNERMIEALLDRHSATELPAGELVTLPSFNIHLDDLQAQVDALLGLAGRSDWIDRGLNNLRNGCPTTAGIVLEQLRRLPELNLADTFRLELTVATHCARNPDFREGVRALLIDKDNDPHWQFGDISRLEWPYVLGHFEAPWPEHPLADLGQS